ncbi:hypothetical protein [Symbiobacterium terraclitae]|uniref:hypothetical protein n=1 Tax=Symbiobacterium terraclitae TaxID=557451 RepID=UPI0035B53C81
MQVVAIILMTLGGALVVAMFSVALAACMLSSQISQEEEAAFWPQPAPAAPGEPTDEEWAVAEVRGVGRKEEA